MENFNFKYSNNVSQKVIEFFNNAKTRNDYQYNAFKDLKYLDSKTKSKARQFGGKFNQSNDTYEVGNFKVFKIDLNGNDEGEEYYVEEKLIREWLPKAVAVYDFDGSKGGTSLDIYKSFKAITNNTTQSPVALANSDGKSATENPQERKVIKKGQDLNGSSTSENIAQSATEIVSVGNKQAQQDISINQQVIPQEQFQIQPGRSNTERNQTKEKNASVSVDRKKKAEVMRLINSNIASINKAIDSTEVNSLNPFDHIANTTTGDNWWNPFHRSDTSLGTLKLNKPLIQEKQKLEQIFNQLNSDELTTEQALEKI
ncbi:MAG: hypothetical protein QNJ31_04870 [Candidatus Caenarcaniphilales bacterium]|nr:hypothetical protein [Candidatus Caenarcaniphilales bacterium]